MRILLRGKRIIDGLGGIIKQGEVVVEDRRIVYAGPQKKGNGTVDAVYNLDGRTLMPGIIDTHTHGYERWYSLPGAHSLVSRGLNKCANAIRRH